MARHWIFDLDGTLINSYPLYREILEQVSREFGIELSRQAWEDLPHLILPKFLEKYFPEKSFRSAFDRVVELNLSRQSEIQAYAGIQEVVEHLHSSDRTLSICTARELKTAKGILYETGLHRYFPRLVSRDCVVNTKPHPEGIHRLMAQAQSEAHDTLMIGDHFMDIQAAKAAGVTAVSVGWNEFAPDELASHSDRHFTSTQDFSSWVRLSLPVGSKVTDDHNQEQEA